MRYVNGMDEPAVKQILITLSSRLVTQGNSNAYQKTGSSVCTHDLCRDDLGLKIMRLVKNGLVNEECIIVAHTYWMVAIERKWPLWDEQDVERRLLGNVHFYVSGDMRCMRETALFVDLAEMLP